MRGRLAIAVCGALLLARCGCTGGEPWAVATVQVDSQAVTRCVQVVAQAPDGGKSTSASMTAKPELKVAVFAGDLGTDVSVRAEGYSDPRCGNAMDEASPWRRVPLQTKDPQGVTLVIRPEGSCSDGDDGDGDGRVDCADPACAGAPECTGADAGDGGVFPYVPSNFTVDLLPRPDAGILIDCDAGYDTAAANGYFCGRTVPAAVPVTMLNGLPATLLPVGPLTITSTGRLTVTGDRPLILAVVGSAQLDGPLLAGADLARPGPGGSQASCAGDGMPATAGGGGGSGGGGGAYGTPGAAGGLGGSSGAGVAGTGGAPFGGQELVPLRGGCSGGPGGESTPGCLRPGGAGGGALQLSVSGVLQVSSAIAAPGGGGQGGEVAYRCGGGGGGSGGGLLLEALRLELGDTARLTANGGGGAEGGDDVSNSRFGGNGRVDGPYPAPGGDSLSYASAGGDGGAGSALPVGGENYSMGLGGGGGGGGSVGRIRINSVQGCVLSGGPDLLYSPRPTSNLAGDAGCP